MATLGNLAKKVPLRYFIGIGMIISTFVYMSIGIFYFIFDSFSQTYLMIAMILNGYFQCTCWPGVVAIMGNWFTGKDKGFIIGFWSISGNIGNITGLIMCNVFDNVFNFTWVVNLLGGGLIMLCVAIFVCIFLKESPTNSL